MRLLELWRHPVKSLQGERLGSATVEGDGLVGDRSWGIRDAETGTVLTARRDPQLLTAAACLHSDGTPRITLPDGTNVDGVGPDSDATLSGWLGRRVELVPAAAAPPAVGEFYADATDDASAVLEWTMPGGRFVDTMPVLILTTASLRAGAAALPGADWAVRRFRPNLLVEAGGTGWLEDEWFGRTLRVGEVELSVAAPCTRCTMVTRPQPDLPRDLDVYRTLLALHNGNFGALASIAMPGTVSVGDPVHVTEGGGISHPSSE